MFKLSRAPSPARLAPLLLVAALWPWPAAGQNESTPRQNESAPGQRSAQEIRDLLNKRERERANREREILRWESDVRRSDLPRNVKLDPKKAIVEIRHEADEMAAAWEFHPERVGNPASSPIRLSTAIKGSTWIKLAPGRWELVLRAGTVRGGAVRFPPQTLSLGASRVYRVSFGEREENQTRKILADRERAKKQTAAQRRRSGR